jgi:hypothetical protein
MTRFCAAAELHGLGAHLMASHSRSKTFFWIAAVLPLLVTFGSSQVAYSTGNYPWISPIAHVGAGVGVVLGFVFFCGVQFRSWPTRIGAMFAYLIVAAFASLLVGFSTACGNGDCL